MFCHKKNYAGVGSLKPTNQAHLPCHQNWHLTLHLQRPPALRQPHPTLQREVLRPLFQLLRFVHRHSDYRHCKACLIINLP